MVLFQSGKWGEVLPISWPFLSPRFLPSWIFSLPPQLQKHSQGWTWRLHVLRMEVSTQCLLSSVPWLLLVLHTCSSGLLVLCLPLINSASAQDCPVWLLQLAPEDPDLSTVWRAREAAGDGGRGNTGDGSTVRSEWQWERPLGRMWLQVMESQPPMAQPMNTSHYPVSEGGQIR